jgi:U4/U6.U5 tri-snRNP-associated protein 1
LSHKFHGKKSGKNKTEKKLMRIGEEMKSKHILANDATQLVEKRKDLGHAHITLSVGNKP